MKVRTVAAVMMPLAAQAQLVGPGSPEPPTWSDLIWYFFWYFPVPNLLPIAIGMLLVLTLARLATQMVRRRQARARQPL